MNKWKNFETRFRYDEPTVNDRTYNKKFWSNWSENSRCYPIYLFDEKKNDATYDSDCVGCVTDIFVKDEYAEIHGFVSDQYVCNLIDEVGDDNFVLCQAVLIEGEHNEVTIANKEACQLKYFYIAYDKATVSTRKDRDYHNGDLTFSDVETEI